MNAKQELISIASNTGWDVTQGVGSTVFKNEDSVLEVWWQDDVQSVLRARFAHGPLEQWIANGSGSKRARLRIVLMEKPKSLKQPGLFTKRKLS